MGNFNLRNIFENIIRQLKNDGYKSYKKIELEKIEHFPAYYETMRDFKENLLMFEDAIRKIANKYAPYSFENAFKEEFGEELSPDDFQYKERIDAYSERNKVPLERLHELKRERLKLREKISNEIFHEVTLAKSILLVRDGNCPDYMLSKAARLEKIYGNSDKAAEYQEMLDKVRAEKTKIKEEVRWDILNNLSDVIVANLNPYGKKPEVQDDWKKPIDYLKKELQARGIAIDELGRNQEIREIWTKSNEQMKRERNERRTLAQVCACVPEPDKSQQVQSAPIKTTEAREEFNTR